jgi:hypothetical protein
MIYFRLWEGAIMSEVCLGREYPPLTLWRVDGFEESGSSAGSYTVLVLTTGDVPDPHAALAEVAGDGASWVSISSLRVVASADLAGGPC